MKNYIANVGIDENNIIKTINFEAEDFNEAQQVTFECCRYVEQTLGFICPFFSIEELDGDFEMNIDLKELPDSMCLESGTHICRYKDGDDTVEIDVRGEVEVWFEDDTYYHFVEMPYELQELFKTGKAYDDERVNIQYNNWYEVFFNWDEDYDVADAIEGYDAKQLREFCAECMDLFRK